MKKINIMHITYDMRIGGTEMVIKNIIEASDKERFAMSIFCIEEPLGPWGIDMQNNGVSINSVSRKEGFDFSVIRAIRKRIKTNGINVVHCHQYTPWVYGTLATLGLKAKVIFTEHGRFYPDSSSWKRRFINPVLAAMTDAITAISIATKNALVDYEFLNASRIQVIYNGIKALPNSNTQAETRRKYGIDDDTTLLGTIARLDPIKNHPMILRGLKQCVDMGLNVKLMIVGDGEQRQVIEELISNLDLTNHVILTGYISLPADLLAAFDIYLLTSFSEGTSMTLLEAMSIGKACVVTDVGGNAEVVKHELNGLVIESDNDEHLSLSIKRLMINPLDILKMAKSSKERYSTLFSADKMAFEFSKIYERLA